MRRTLSEARLLLTGASSGIGQALALELAGRGARLLITARRQQRLAKLAGLIQQSGGSCRVLAGDVTDPAHRSELLRVAAEELGGLDLLINNAGIGAIGPFTTAEPARLRQVMEVNFFAPVELIRLALPLLRNGRNPLVANVASVLAHRAVPNKSEYCASKFALHGFSDALRAELAGEGIDVLLISPSTTSSEFFENVLEDRQGGQHVTKRAMTPQRVARIAVQAMQRGRHEVILSAGGKGLVWLDRIFPSLADRLIARFSQAHPPKLGDPRP